MTNEVNISDVTQARYRVISKVGERSSERLGILQLKTIQILNLDRKKIYCGFELYLKLHFSLIFTEE